MDFRKIMLNTAIPFENAYNEKLFAIGTVDIVKDMMSSALLTEMSTQSYYRYIRVAKMVFRHEIVLSLVENLNADDAGSKVWESPIWITLHCT